MYSGQNKRKLHKIYQMYCSFLGFFLAFLKKNFIILLFFIYLFLFYIFFNFYLFIFYYYYY